MANSPVVVKIAKVGIFLYGYTQKGLARFHWISIYVMAGALTVVVAIAIPFDSLTNFQLSRFLMTVFSPPSDSVWATLSWVLPILITAAIYGFSQFSLYRFTGNLKAAAQRAMDTKVHGDRAEVAEEPEVETTFSKMISVIGAGMMIFSFLVNIGDILYNEINNGLLAHCSNIIEGSFHFLYGLVLAICFAFALFICGHIAMMLMPPIWHQGKVAKLHAATDLAYAQAAFQKALDDTGVSNTPPATAPAKP